MPLLSNGVFPRQCWPLVDFYLGVFDWKVQIFCWPKGTSLECAELIYVKITETVCVSDELCRFKEEEEEEEEEERLVSSGDSRINRVLDRLATLNVLTVRVVAMEYSQVHKKA